MTWDWIFRRKPKTPPKPGADELSELIETYRDALEGFPRVERPAEWTAIQLELGKASYQLGQLLMNDHGAEARRHFGESASAFDQVAKSAPSGSPPWSLARACFMYANMAIEIIAESKIQAADAFSTWSAAGYDLSKLPRARGESSWEGKALRFLEALPDAKGR